MSFITRREIRRVIGKFDYDDDDQSYLETARKILVFLSKRVIN